jgi:16S rRNA C967 or C1407 C5-methylase (RsmB/RsmF family)
MFAAGAAPGSKTTQLAAFMQNDGFILANEVNAIRAERLKFNLNRQGVSMAEVRVGDGKKLEDNWHEFFDSVLLDAPCSGVGIISMDSPQTYRGWSPRDVSKLAHEQKRLIESAVWALKPGGSMVYSTCTLTREENLDNVHWALDTFKGTLERQPIELKLTGVDNLDREGGIQLLPSSLYEGFFVAKFRKRG